MMAKNLTNLWTDWMSESRAMTRKLNGCATTIIRDSSNPYGVFWKFEDKLKALRFAESRYLHFLQNLRK